MGVAISSSRPQGATERRTMTDSDLLTRVRAVAAARADEPLGRHTTFGIGGPADVFATVRSAAELAAVIGVCREAGEPWFILGSGSNILVGDLGVRGVVIDNQAKRVDGPLEHQGEWRLTAESGTSFAALARHLARDGFGGFEWACGIPGTLGGAVVYNAGAYGGCTADVLISAQLLLEDGAVRETPAADLSLTYRNSIFTRGECDACAVLSATLRVMPGDPGILTQRIADTDRERLRAQPRGRTGGSTFKNPEGHHAWELIDAVGLRGYRIGGARISDLHANFFLNVHEATARDVYALMQEARARVRDRFGIELENEVRLVGEGFE